MTAPTPPPGFGHGHVIPRPDGVKARCGGPALCGVCAKELAAQQTQPPGFADWLAAEDMADCVEFDRADLEAAYAAGRAGAERGQVEQMQELLEERDGQEGAR